MRLLRLMLAVLYFGFTVRGGAQSPGAGDARPLPDVAGLMRQVEANQRTSEAIEKDYIFHEATQFDKLDGHDQVKKTETSESDIFWLNGVQVSRLVRKDGKDLTAEEYKKEGERIDALAAKARERRDKADGQGKETDPQGHEEITLSRILELGAFSNPRREVVDGRDTIAVDFTGNPNAKTRNYSEGVFRELAGTVWVDEEDKSIERLEGHFDHDFKMGGGLLVNVKKGTWFRARLARLHNEVWLPAEFEADGHARYLLFFNLNGHVRLHFSDYRKFRATSTILPGVTAVKPDEEDTPPPAPPEPR
jgi:hypothetical protein